MTKTDVNSLLQEHGDKAVVYLDTISADELEERIKAATANGHDKAEPEKPPFDPRFTFVNIDSITKPILKGAFAIHGLLQANGLATFYGASGCGKSFGALHAMLCVATGQPYAGRPTKKSHVIYIVAEGGGLFPNRVYAAKQHMKIAPGEAALELIAARPNLGTGDKDARALLKAIEVQRHKSPFEDLPLIVVIDTMAKTMKGAKEDEVGIGMFMENCALIVDEFKGLAIPIHHVGKDPDKGSRGWSGLGAGADGEVLFKKLRSGISQVIAKKVKDGEDNIEWLIRRETVLLGNDEETGKPITTCVVNIISEPKPLAEEEDEKAEGKTRSSKTNRTQAIFDQAFNEAIIDCGDTFFVGNDGPMVKAVRLEQVRAAFAKKWAVVGTDDSDDTDDSAKKDHKKAKRKRDQAISKAFCRIVPEKLPLRYRTESRNGVDFIWSTE